MTFDTCHECAKPIAACDCPASIRKHPAPLTVLSLFAGIGGIDLGLESTGRYTTIAYSETDPYACQVMQRHFPNATNLGDITRIDWHHVAPVDVIVGGFPCQDISLAGKGAGIDGKQSGLWAHYASAIRALRPRGVIVENVAALLHRGIDRVLGDLAACGYDAEWDCIPAAAVGAPHLRDRLFVIAYRTNAIDTERATTPADTGAGTRHRERAEPGSDANGGRCEINTECNSNPRRQPRRNEPTEHRHDTHGFRRSDERRAPAANPDEQRAQVPDQRRQPTIEQPRRESSAWRPWRTPTGSDWWIVEPEVGRVAHGISRRVDRLRCLGNAVVPQVAEHIGRILLDRIEPPR